VSALARRGWCPGLSSPMPTGDGLLVRFLPADHIPIAAFIALCAAARRHGNGTIEISARGSLQMRGLTQQSAPVFARDVQCLAIPAADRVISDPLPEDPDRLLDAARLATELRAAVAHARLSLSAKVCAIVDGGGRLHLDALEADLRLRAVATQDGLRLHVAVAGDARSAVSLGLIPPERACDAVVRLFGVIAHQGRRARDCIDALGAAPFRAAIDRDEAYEVPSRAPAEAIGVHPLRDDLFALGIAPVFGHASAEAFSELTRVAGLHGAKAMRPAPGRALLIIGLIPDAIDQLTRAADALGFITRADDTRRGIIACPGSPACAAGLIPARSLAAAIAPQMPNVRGTIHISGCAKGCAHPAPAALTIVGTAQGCGIVRHGTARSAPSRFVDSADLIVEIQNV
jgi:precorrin-3B synthase